jgi:chemotaxis signal transduction protein
MGIYARIKVGAELYAVLVDHIVEIRELGDGTQVPGAPPAVLGVRNVRGQILPVADLASLLGVQRLAAPSLMLVAEDAGLRVGLAINEVVDVGEMPEPPEPADLSLLTGATLTGGELVGVIDVPRVLQTLGETAP